MSRIVSLLGALLLLSQPMVWAGGKYFDPEKKRQEAIFESTRCRLSEDVLRDLAEAIDEGGRLGSQREYARDLLVKLVEEQALYKEFGELVEGRYQEFGKSSRALVRSAEAKIRLSRLDEECRAVGFLRSKLRLPEGEDGRSLLQIWAAEELCKVGDRESLAEIETILIRFSAPGDNSRLKLCRQQLALAEQLRGGGRENLWKALIETAEDGSRTFHLYVLDRIFAVDALSDSEVRGLLNYSIEAYGNRATRFEAIRTLERLREQGLPYETVEAQNTPFALVVEAGYVPPGLEIRSLAPVVDLCSDQSKGGQ